MISFSETVHVALDPVDFRLGLDGLGMRAQAVTGAAVFTDTFVFFNRGRNRVKILRYDRFGFWLCYQRLAKGHYARCDSAQVSLAELRLLLEGIDLRVARLQPVSSLRVA